MRQHKKKAIAPKLGFEPTPNQFEPTPNQFELPIGNFGDPRVATLRDRILECLNELNPNRTDTSS
jgi:hypothetical protein